MISFDFGNVICYNMRQQREDSKILTTQNFKKLKTKESAMKRNITAKETAPIEIYGDSIVLLHKVLKEEDLLKSIHRAEKSGEEATVTPVILIDFATVTSIQEDYKRHGTIIMDNNKTAVIVKEPLADVLDVWCEIKDRLAKYRD